MGMDVYLVVDVVIAFAAIPLIYSTLIVFIVAAAVVHVDRVLICIVVVVVVP